mmetsp:Transcript_147221/g.455385  ORF Transcript_147221/g.455385 Transcript_147221/m.455385 type:complete len:84 (-) Transcript_147221:80-331(-)
MVAAELQRRPDLSVAPPAPEALWALAWEADHLRRRSEGFRPAEPPVRAADRAELAGRVAGAYRALGIEAARWSSARARSSSGG